MPRIRKKTSNRGTSHQRAKIRHKVTETRKKAKKAAKKNPQWKSKHPKDPGIPNSFPYKAEILAEVAEQRRQEQEEKQRRKEQKKAERAAAKNGEEKEHEEDGVEEEANAFDGISIVAAPPTKETSTKGKKRTRVRSTADSLIKNTG